MGLVEEEAAEISGAEGARLGVGSVPGEEGPRVQTKEGD